MLGDNISYVWLLFSFFKLSRFLDMDKHISKESVYNVSLKNKAVMCLQAQLDLIS